MKITLNLSENLQEMLKIHFEFLIYIMFAEYVSSKTEMFEFILKVNIKGQD